MDKEGKTDFFVVGQRVLWKVLINNPGHHKPGEEMLGTIIAAYGNPRLYRVELDQVWNERMVHAQGKKIVVGGVNGRQLTPTKV